MISRATPIRACRRRALLLRPSITPASRAPSITVRHYLPAGQSPKHDVLPTNHPHQHDAAVHHNRPPLVRFLNPWIDMANVSDDAILAFKVESVTRTFGIVATLMCSLSAAALAVAPDDDQEENDDAVETNELFHHAVHHHTSTTPASNDDSSTEEKAEEDEYEDAVLSMLHHLVNAKQHVAGTSLLVHWGVPPSILSDIYSACCAASFYSSVCAMGLSAVLNAWLGCTPAGGTKHFVRYHSLVICSIPGFLAISTGLAGVALFIGLDRSKGTPISYIGLGGTMLGAFMVGSATVRGMSCTYRLLTPLAVNAKKKVL